MAATGGFVAGEVVRFSDNLNCFIGGRGTGKSTAVRSLAYCLGADEAFGEFESCPDCIVVYCKDADGIVYRYERAKGGDVSVKAKEDSSITDVPTDSFRIEYFGQGELARVAEDPLNNPQVFQEFLDRHIRLVDLQSHEESLVGQLRDNAARLEPMERSFGQLDEKKKALADIEKKLKVAEEGKLRDIVGVQTRIASEKSVGTTIETIITKYNNGVTLSNLANDFNRIVTTAGEVTDDKDAQMTLEGMRQSIDAINFALITKAKEINVLLKAGATELKAKCDELKSQHARMEASLAAKIANLKAKGLAGNLAELEQLLKQKIALAKDVAAIEQKEGELKECRKERQDMLGELRSTRAEMTKRRKDQLSNINANLARTITDYKPESVRPPATLCGVRG